MEATQIIRYIRNQHLTISLSDDGHLELSPAEKITDKSILRLRKHKTVIVKELKCQQRIENMLIESIRG